MIYGSNFGDGRDATALAIATLADVATIIKDLSPIHADTLRLSIALHRLPLSDRAFDSALSILTALRMIDRMDDTIIWLG